MIYGALMLIGVHLLFTLPILNQWWFATIVMIVLGIAFSLVPSAMWPSVPEDYPGEAIRHGLCLDFLGTEYRSEYGSLINRLDIGYVL